MIKNKKLNSAVALLAACSLTAAGFTSHAAAFQANVNAISAVSGNVMSELQMDTLREAPVNLVSTTAENLEVQYQQMLEEAARKAQEAKEQAEREAQEAAIKVSQQKLLAAIIFCEAGNQPYKGQVAVGAVVMNRVKSSVYPNSIEEVIYQKGQFGPATTGWLDKVRKSAGYTDSAMQAAADALAGSNPVGNCLYFDQGGNGMKIGDHYFH